MTSKEKLIEFLKSANIDYIITISNEYKTIRIYYPTVYHYFDFSGQYLK